MIDNSAVFLSSQRDPFKKTANVVVLLFLLLLLAACSTEQEKKTKGGRTKPAVPVKTAISTTQTIPMEIAAIGHVEALDTVEIRSQAAGLLHKVHFQEGQEVQEGDLLFTIDPRPFAADLTKAQALLAKERADLENARRDLARYQPAAAKGLVSQEQADQARTRVATLNATIQADQAAVEIAELALGYCSIRAPFSGQTGEILSDQGNLIKANADSPMVTINRIDPILISFTLPGHHLPAIKKYRQQQDLMVLARSMDDQTAVSGKLVFIDNTVDPTTGVIRIKAEFANANHRLWPGQLINVRIHLTDQPDCVVVPSQAIQMGQQGPYLFVVKADQRTEYRLVTPGMRYQQNTVVEQGLKSGEKVVIDGQMLIDEGAKVVERGQDGAAQEKKQP